MSFMIPEYDEATPRNPFWEVETPHGESSFLPSECGPREVILRDHAEPGDIVRPISAGWFHRLSVPGYMDATDWSGPFDTIAEARQDLSDLYDIDPDTGEELES